MEALLCSVRLRRDDWRSVHVVRPHIDRPKQVLIFEGEVIRVVPYVRAQVVGARFELV